MAKILEKNLWKWLRGARDQVAAGGDYVLDLQRVENAATAGMADVNGCLRLKEERIGAEFWIELKTMDFPRKPRSPIRVPLRLEQIEWLRVRWHAGGLAWVLVQLGDGADARRYIVPGQYASILKNGLGDKRNHIEESELREQLAATLPGGALPATPLEFLLRASYRVEA